eukprot:COSAG01_NODE_1309_length_10793_cov_10.360483_11_plen_65_part_00
MLTYGALTGPHGGYSELDTGGAQSAGASPNDVCTAGAAALAGGGAAAFVQTLYDGTSKETAFSD